MHKNMFCHYCVLPLLCFAIIITVKHKEKLPPCDCERMKVSIENIKCHQNWLGKVSKKTFFWDFVPNIGPHLSNPTHRTRFGPH